VWIPKSNGGQRPLGIPCIRDRVVEMAVLLVLSPIFETDLLRNQYGFRPKLDAKMAVRQAFGHVSDHGRSEGADADLSDYFSSIPHGPLMRCVSRRVADGTLLSVIKSWLTAPVIERDQRKTQCTTEAKDRHRGTPPGSPISPLLAPRQRSDCAGDHATVDGPARTDGERSQDWIGATARGEL